MRQFSEDERCAPIESIVHISTTHGFIDDIKSVIKAKSFHLVALNLMPISIRQQLYVYSKTAIQFSNCWIEQTPTRRDEKMRRKKIEHHFERRNHNKMTKSDAKQRNSSSICMKVSSLLCSSLEGNNHQHMQRNDRRFGIVHAPDTLNAHRQGAKTIQTVDAKMYNLLNFHSANYMQALIMAGNMRELRCKETKCDRHSEGAAERQTDRKRNLCQITYMLNNKNRHAM